MNRKGAKDAKKKEEKKEKTFPPFCVLFVSL